MKHFIYTLKNTTVTDVYEPGSTFKICTYSAGLEENVFDFNSCINCGGSRTIASSTIHCWKRSGHGGLNMLEVIQNVCNSNGFMKKQMK